MTPSNPQTPASPAADIGLVLAYAGRHGFLRTRWTEHRLPYWVLDVITRGRQAQRLAHGPPFERTSGVLALYAPATLYHERQIAGEGLDEAYMVFTASGGIAASLSRLTAADGYCHIEDPHQLVIAPLQRLGARFLVHGAPLDALGWGFLLECLGYLPTSTVLGPGRRRLVPEGNPEEALRVRVARFLEAHVDRSISVSELATALHMSPSTLAHTYPKLTGQTPYQAILQSKITAAKRLLLSKRLNVQQTAHRLGFSSPFNFSRAFKRLEGCGPRQYVARHTSP